MTLNQRSTLGLLIQFLGMAIPLIELPILTRALGASQYGIVAFIYGIALTASLFIEYGFNLSGTKDIAKAKINSEVGSIVGNITLAKLLLSAPTFTISLLLLYTTTPNVITPEILIYFFLTTAALGFSPSWYYFGKRKIFFISSLDVTLRATGLILTYSLIKQPDDLTKYMWIQASVGACNTLLPSVLIFKTNSIRFDIKSAIALIQKSSNFFLYRGTQTVINSIASNLLGIFSNATAVGFFSPAEKLTRAFNTLSATIINFYFPTATKQFTTCKEHALNNILKINIWLGGFSCISSIGIFFYSDLIVRLLFGTSFSESIACLRILCWVIPLRVLISSFSLLWLAQFNLEKIISRIAIINLLTILLIAPLAIFYWGSKGMAATFLVSDLISTLLTLKAIIQTIGHKK